MPPPPPPGTWKEMQDRYLRRVMENPDDPGYANGTRRRELRKYKRPARTPMEVAVATAELSIAERQEAEEAKQSVEDLRRVVREKRAEATQLRKEGIEAKERAQALEFKLQEARAFSVQQDKTIHSLSTQFHRKERQVRGMLRLEHGRLIRLVTRFILAVDGVSARVDRLRDEVRGAVRPEGES